MINNDRSLMPILFYMNLYQRLLVPTTKEKEEMQFNYISSFSL